jgi:hypothetical protein
MKAFDTVSHNGLKVKLYDLGIIGKMWNLLDKKLEFPSFAVFNTYNNQRLHKRNVGRNKGNVISLYWTTNIEIYHDSIFS